MGKENIDNPEFEIIFNGRVMYVAIGWDCLNDIIKYYKNQLREKGFEEELSSSGGSSGYMIYLNENKLLTNVMAWRMRTGFVDNTHEIIYYGDTLIDIGTKKEFELYRHSGRIDKNRQYYIRTGNTDIDITAEEIKARFCVRHMVFPEVPSKSYDPSYTSYINYEIQDC